MDVSQSSLKESVKKFLSVRDETLSHLEGLKSNVQKRCISTKKATVAGSSLSMVGSGAAIGGICLAPFTAGGSLALSATGGALVAGGGITGIAATITDISSRKKSVKSVLKSLEKDKLAQKEMEDVCKRFQYLQRMRHDEVKVDVDNDDGLVPILNSYKGTRSTALDVSRQIATGAGTVAKGVGMAGNVAKVFSVGAVAVTAFTVPLDIATIVKASKDIKKYKTTDCDAAEYISQLITTLEVHRAKVAKYLDELENGSYLHADEPTTEEQRTKYLKALENGSYSHADEPTTDQQSSHADESTTDQQGSHADEPKTDQQSTHADEPTTDQQSSHADEPTTDQQSSHADEPTTDQQSSHADEPTTDQQSSHADEPTTDKQISLADESTNHHGSSPIDEPTTNHQSLRAVEPKTEQQSSREDERKTEQRSSHDDERTTEQQSSHASEHTFEQQQRKDGNHVPVVESPSIATF